MRPLEPWPHSEAGRFPRGISLVMVALAVLELVVAGVRNHDLARWGSWCRRSPSRRTGWASSE